jgi:single-strand DNA-binding protein
MAGDTVITIVGNVTGDPELRFTPSGAAVANFTVASTPRAFDRQSNEWKDGETLFMRCSVWRDAAENVAESLAARHPGHRHRPAQEPVLRDQGRREAHRHRDGGRRGRPLAAVRHGQGGAHPAWVRAPAAASAARADRAGGYAGQESDPWATGPAGGGHGPQGGYGQPAGRHGWPGWSGWLRRGPAGWPHPGWLGRRSAVLRRAAVLIRSLDADRRHHNFTTEF